MGQKMLRVPLNEVTTIRVRCTKCNRGVVEVPVTRADTALDNRGQCLFCQHQHVPQGAQGTHDPLNYLRLAFDELKRLGGLEIEFEFADVP